MVFQNEKRRFSFTLLVIFTEFTVRRYGIVEVVVMVVKAVVVVVVVVVVAIVALVVKVVVAVGVRRWNWGQW